MSIVSKIEDNPVPVELLRDSRGIYGIGVSDLFDYEAVAWSCGVEPEAHAFKRPPNALILRPDWFMDTKPHEAVLQKIVGGFRRGPFMRSGEEKLWQVIHHEALNRAGLPWPPSDSFKVRWWATDKKQQAHNRGIYHGLRMLSLHVINNLIGNALEEAADGAALEAARRFTFAHRECIYRAAALSRPALQLTETFPVLALAIYSIHWRLEPHIADPNWFDKVDLQMADLAERKRLAGHLVDRGARLRDVAAVMNIPMALRCIKPGVAHLATDIFCRAPRTCELHALHNSRTTHLAARSGVCLRQCRRRFCRFCGMDCPPRGRNSRKLPAGPQLSLRHRRLGVCWATSPKMAGSGGVASGRTGVHSPRVHTVHVAQDGDDIECGVA